MAKKPITRGETSVTPSQIGRRTAKVPLNISTKKVMVPAVLPRTRKVLVVPVFPEPCSRRLVWKNSFPNPEAGLNGT